MSVVRDGKGIAFSSFPWFQIACGFFLFLAIVIITVPMSFHDVEKGRFSEATHWFSARLRKTELPVLKNFALKGIHEGKNGWSATLTRLPGESGCPRKYGCYSVTFESTKREFSCSNEACTQNLLP